MPFYVIRDKKCMIFLEANLSNVYMKKTIFTVVVLTTSLLCYRILELIKGSCLHVQGKIAATKLVIFKIRKV